MNWRWLTACVNRLWKSGKEGAEMIFKKKIEKKTYDANIQKPVIKASICNGEQVFGFKNINTGVFEEVMMIKTPEELRRIKEQYGIIGEIEKIY